MAGFYVHIPFCRKVCYYCDFHFVAGLKAKSRVLDAMHNETEQRKNDWQEHQFETIYFGGGTPSVLSIDEIKALCETIFKNYNFSESPEFTIEANPDDLTPAYLRALKSETSINRLSIGIQSFNDNILKFLNRRHSGKQAIDSVNRARDAGFDNITIDLIYGIPGLTNAEWEKALVTFLGLGIKHLAAYHLAIEPKTVFGVWQKKNRIAPVSDNVSVQQYKMLTGILAEAGFEHYEISNFAAGKMYSKHNTAYWQNIPYIGIGPSAHSYNKNVRRWNLPNNTLYSNCLTDKPDRYFEEENLSTDERFNDYILTSLRTMWGASLEKIENDFGRNYSEWCHETLANKAVKDNIVIQGRNFRIPESSWLIADRIMEAFFRV
ncbi:MAG: radical SAM family heme chaperone HemW [Bacteroidales bacterium]|nr:radical SAM family heme chaperone HemW [Bacteroidales bacterium]